MRGFGILLTAVLFLAGVGARADDTVSNLRFRSGADNTVVSGFIQGYDTASYLLDVRAGQQILVAMTGSNPQNYFNVSPPGSDSAVFNGSISGNNWNGTARRSGKYRIDIYLMRAAARRDESSRYKLAVTIPADTGYGDGSNDGDYADGNAGGPDNWVVAGVPPGDRLNVRVAPRASAVTVARLRNGSVLRNLGCRFANGSRWCRVALGADTGIRGWVNGRYLREF
ncbi:MAG: SH3 domain-containing protein [Hyphomicrobiales bacterium]